MDATTVVDAGPVVGPAYATWRLTAEQAATLPSSRSAPHVAYMPILRASAADADTTGTWLLDLSSLYDRQYVKNLPPVLYDRACLLSLRLSEGRLDAAAWIGAYTRLMPLPIRDAVLGLIAENEAATPSLYLPPKRGIHDVITRRMRPAWVAPGIAVLYAVELDGLDDGYDRFIIVRDPSMRYAGDQYRWVRLGDTSYSPEVWAGFNRLVGALAIRRGAMPVLDERFIPMSEALARAKTGDAVCTPQALAALAAFGDQAAFGGAAVEAEPLVVAEEAAFQRLLAASAATVLPALEAWREARTAATPKAGAGMPGLVERALQLRDVAHARNADNLAAGRFGSAATWGHVQDAAEVLTRPALIWNPYHWRAWLREAVAAALPAADGLDTSQPLFFPWTPAFRTAGDGTFIREETPERDVGFRLPTIAAATAAAKERWRFTFPAAIESSPIIVSETAGPRQVRRFSESNATAVAAWQAREAQRQQERQQMLARIATLTELAKSIPYDTPVGDNQQVLVGYEDRYTTRTVGPYEGNASGHGYKQQGSTERIVTTVPVYRYVQRHDQNPNHPVLVELGQLRKRLETHDPAPQSATWRFEPVSVTYLRSQAPVRLSIGIDDGQTQTTVDMQFRLTAGGEEFRSDRGQSVLANEASSRGAREQRLREAIADPAGAGAADVYRAMVLHVWQQRWTKSLGSADEAAFEAAALADVYFSDDPSGGSTVARIRAVLERLRAKR